MLLMNLQKIKMQVAKQADKKGKKGGKGGGKKGKGGKKGGKKGKGDKKGKKKGEFLIQTDENKAPRERQHGKPALVRERIGLFPHHNS